MPEREDEIEALEAIFGEEFRSMTRENIEISVNLDDNYQIKLQCFLPEEYPSVLAEPTLEGECLTDASKAALRSQLENIAMHDAGSVIVFKWVDWLRESALDFLSRNGHLDLQRDQLDGEQSAHATDGVSNTNQPAAAVDAASPALDLDPDLNALGVPCDLPDWTREDELVQKWTSWSAFDQQDGMRCGVWGELDGDYVVFLHHRELLTDTQRRGSPYSRSGALFCDGRPSETRRIILFAVPR
jgi:hypothetical protein